jgi:hypothetical protein
MTSRRLGLMSRRRRNILYPAIPPLQFLRCLTERSEGSQRHTAVNPVVASSLASDILLFCWRLTVGRLLGAGQAMCALTPPSVGAQKAIGASRPPQVGALAADLAELLPTCSYKQLGASAGRRLVNVKIRHLVTELPRSASVAPPE